ncbi:unnamed protein product [Musa acuminata subsp. malaccensis]|uniref:(wild Malaysian banana) hypothetical protein n=1 Tax=Musa acuminata subsp. malaccensis TaxID=214687 RepID=A0A804KDQ4_MUSAM|nr:unnamed protein product [Musa acuminata subsp. malaccensis]
MTGPLNTDLGFNVAASPSRYASLVTLTVSRRRRGAPWNRCDSMGLPPPFRRGKNGRGGRRFSSDLSRQITAALPSSLRKRYSA